MYCVIRDRRKLLRKPVQSIRAEKDDSPTSMPQSFKFKEVRVLLKRVNVDFCENTETEDSPETDVLVEEFESNLVTEEPKPSEPEDLINVQIPNDAIRPEVSKGMYAALLEKRQTSPENPSPT